MIACQFEHVEESDGRPLGSCMISQWSSAHQRHGHYLSRVYMSKHCFRMDLMSPNMYSLGFTEYTKIGLDLFCFEMTLQ